MPPSTCCGRGAPAETLGQLRRPEPLGRLTAPSAGASRRRHADKVGDGPGHRDADLAALKRSTPPADSHPCAADVYPPAAAAATTFRGWVPCRLLCLRPLAP